MFGTRRPIFSGGLDIQLLDRSVVHDHRIALRALPHAKLAAVEGEPKRVGEGAVAIGQHRDVERPVAIVPCRHDEGVIDRNAGDLIEAFALQLLRLLDIGGQVACRAGRRESARNGEQSDTLAAKILAAGGRLWSVARRDGQGHVGQALADLNGHDRSPLGWVETADRLAGRAPQGLSGTFLGPIVRSWLRRRVSCPASRCWRCREWPTRASSGRSSHYASMTKMAPSALASAISVPASAFADCCGSSTSNRATRPTALFITA